VCDSGKIIFFLQQTGSGKFAKSSCQNKKKDKKEDFLFLRMITVTHVHSRQLLLPS